MSHDLYYKYFRSSQASQTFCSVTPFFEKRFLCDHLVGNRHINDVKTTNVQLQILADIETNFDAGASSKIKLIIRRSYKISEFNLLWEKTLNKEIPC